MRKMDKESYSYMPNGTILRVFLTGDGWEDTEGSFKKVIKVDNRLYEIEGGWFDFNERDESEFSFEVYKVKRDRND